VRNGERVLRRGTEAGTPLHQGHTEPSVSRLCCISARYSSLLSLAETIHLVLDNLSTHTRKAATDWFGEEDGGWLWSRFTIHHTPKHGSWLNQAEIEIGLFSRQCLGKRTIASIEKLTQQAAASNQRTNHAKTTIDWKFTRKKARLKLKYKLMRS